MVATKLKTTTAFLILGQANTCRLMVHNQEAASGSIRDVLKVARERLGRVTLDVWDEEKWEFTSEMVADETV